MSDRRARHYWTTDRRPAGQRHHQPPAWDRATHPRVGAKHLPGFFQLLCNTLFGGLHVGRVLPWGGLIKAGDKSTRRRRSWRWRGRRRISTNPRPACLPILHADGGCSTPLLLLLLSLPLLLILLPLLLRNQFWSTPSPGPPESFFGHYPCQRITYAATLSDISQLYVCVFAFVHLCICLCLCLFVCV